MQHKPLTVVEADSHGPLLPLDHVAIHAEGGTFRLDHIQRLQARSPAPLLIHQLLMEVAIQGGNDRVGLVVPELLHPLGLQLHHNYYVQRVGVEVVIGGGAQVDEALDVAPRLGVAHLLSILGCRKASSLRIKAAETCSLMTMSMADQANDRIKCGGGDACIPTACEKAAVCPLPRLSTESAQVCTLPCCIDVDKTDYVAGKGVCKLFWMRRISLCCLSPLLVRSQELGSSGK